MTPPRILLVEDDLNLSELLAYNLENEGFLVLRCYDGEEAIRIAQAQRPDLVLLDWMLPSVSGIEVCRRLRALPGVHDVPILMLTARVEEADRVQGLETGADDYITKPFSPRELIARIKAALRRLRPGISTAPLRFEDIILDPMSLQVERSGRTVPLGPTEFRLLRHFLEHPGRVFSREQLLATAWGKDADVELRTIDVHIRRLRKALNETKDPDILLPDVIRTVRSAGYALALES